MMDLTCVDLACVLEGVSTELWWISDYLVISAKVCSGLRSSTFSSSISVFRFSHGFSSCMVWSAFPYSFLLFRICNANAEIALFFYVSCVIAMLHCYSILQLGQHILHFNLYILLEFIVFSGILSRSWICMVLLVRKAIFNLVFLNKLVTLCMCGL
jgi:hypothetical protein